MGKYWDKNMDTNAPKSGCLDSKRHFLVYILSKKVCQVYYFICYAGSDSSTGSVNGLDDS